MDDLVEFLRARLDEDEQVARAAAGRNWLDGDGWLMNEDMHIAEVGDRPTLVHIAAHDPARVLREIDAKRRIIAEHEMVPAGQGGKLGCDICVATPSWGPEVVSGPCTTLRLLALPYADRPGYRSEWRP
ncbi:DUF6221 family protein [Streptomyces misionensis]|uniref:DUF6221 family protein n=1 Tax=Streptomyces misionensis TaxID=67331 RepID=UPI0036A157B6